MPTATKTKSKVETKTKTVKPEKVYVPASVKVKKSSAGLGLFAVEDIKRGDFVIEYTGERISTKEADTRGGKYIFEINRLVSVDGKDRKNIARYINHACKPNCEVEIKKGRILIFALKNIKRGEEFSFDYGTEYFDTFIKPNGCRCEPCRKRTVVSHK